MPPAYCFDPADLDGDLIVDETNPTLEAGFLGLSDQRWAFFELGVSGAEATLELGVGDARYVLYPGVRVPDWLPLPATVFGNTAFSPTEARPNADRAMMAKPFFPEPPP